MQVTIDGYEYDVPGDTPVDLALLEALEPQAREPQDIALDPAFLSNLRASAMITKLAYSDRDQSVARMVQYDRLRAELGVW